MLKLLVPKFRSDQSVRLRDIAEKRVPAKLIPIAIVHGSSFGSKILRQGPRFRMFNVTWQQPTTPCMHSPPRGIGHTAHQQQDKTGQIVPKYGSWTTFRVGITKQEMYQKDWTLDRLE